MATVTPNYSWPVPTSTDLVKDGATAIEALGDAIDATVFGLGSPALTLIKTQTIGTAVSSVTVTGAFTTTYDNYKVIVAGGVASTNALMGMTLGATATGYYYAHAAQTYANAAASTGAANTTSWARIGLGSSDTITANFDLQNPFNAKFTVINYFFNDPRANGEAGAGGGILNNSTSYTAFTITPASGTYTGGTIYVYGYKK